MGLWLPPHSRWSRCIPPNQCFGCFYSYGFPRILYGPGASPQISVLGASTPMASPAFYLVPVHPPKSVFWVLLLRWLPPHSIWSRCIPPNQCFGCFYSDGFPRILYGPGASPQISVLGASTPMASPAFYMVPVHPPK